MNHIKFYRSGREWLGLTPAALANFSKRSGGADVRLSDVDDRRVRVIELIEWIAAAAGVVLLVWLISVPMQRALGPGVEASLVDIAPVHPAGVPLTARSIPVMLLRDGREIRHGDLRARLESLLPDRFAEGPPLTSNGEFGERHTREYQLEGTRFYIVCERLEPSGPMRVSGIYLP